MTTHYGRIVKVVDRASVVMEDGSRLYLASTWGFAAGDWVRIGNPPWYARTWFRLCRWGERALRRAKGLL